MAYNETEKDKRTAAANDLAQKLKFESSFEPSVKKYFDQISDDFYQQFLTSSNIVDANTYNQDLQQLLSNQYNAVSDPFSKQIRNALGQPEGTEKQSEVDQKVAFALALTSSGFVSASTTQMNNTTNKDLHASVAEVIAAASAAGIILSHKQKADQAKLNFDRKSAGRLETITQDQTQFGAESAKNTEYQTLATTGAVVGGMDVKKAKRNKTWIAILDAKTRKAHVAADGQVVKENEMFTVMGQQLKYPRDSRGSTANIINCRCSAVYSISEQ